MPELPEVQTVVSQLATKVVGLEIVGFESAWPKVVRPNTGEFVRVVTGATIMGTRRFGKHIVIDLDNHHSIVIHLKMTGHLLVKTPANEHASHFTEDQYNGYIRHTIFLSGDVRIEFSDLRKFGWMEVMPTENVEQLESIRTLGVDALVPEFTLKRFRLILGEKQFWVIGKLLLEQGLIAGIGNIYRSEALYRAGILPDRPVGSLTVDETRCLHVSIQQVLREAIRFRGMSDGDFRDTEGRMGAFEENAFVYGREGDKCKRCGTIIIRGRLGQRSVFFCSRCQR